MGKTGEEKKNRRFRDSKRAKSIARRIHRSVWFGKLWDYLVLDVVAAAMLIAIFILSCNGFTLRNADFKKVGEGTQNAEIVGTDYDSLVLRIIYEDGTQKDFPIRSIGDNAVPVFLVIFGIQGIDLLFFALDGGKYRRFLRPMDELAQRAEALSAISLDTTKFESLEQAIRHAASENEDLNDLGMGDLRISTGDDELRSIETAINNLLYRMQEGYRQQVRFVSDASHELRTPIAVIQGYADLLARWGKDDPEILQEGITSIRAESEHMKELVEQLLFLARGDSGRNVLQKTTIDVCGLMEEVCDESSMIDPDHEYVLDLPMERAKAGEGEAAGSAPVHAWIYGDPAMIKQSARIFLQNAMKYSGKGDRIRIGVRTDGKNVSYLIQDEGIGMVSADIAHIFERFYRSDEARGSATGGTGLGLAIAKWIIDAHDGTIDVVSRQDFGTRFTINFKAVDPPSEETQKHSEAEAPAEEA